jgi:hypothetical protein
MYGWVTEWMVEWMDGQVYGWVIKWLDGWLDEACVDQQTPNSTFTPSSAVKLAALTQALEGFC